MIAAQLLSVLVLASGVSACEPATQPPHTVVAELYGTPYERGFQHGERFGDRIRSLYTMMLTNSILPYLNRERPDMAEMLVTYAEDRYDDGMFSYLMLLESGQNIEPWIPEEYIEEMRGISDGSGVPYDDILLLNTFFDSMVGFRAMTFFVRALQAPHVMAVDFGDLTGDGFDNDGDGDVDEPGEGHLEPFDPSQYASMVEVPEDATITISLEDEDGVSSDLIRYQVNLDVFYADSTEVATSLYGESDEGMTVAYTPGGGFDPAGEYTIFIAAGDNTWVDDPPPAHARMMRDMRITFTTRGDGRTLYNVPNRGVRDGRFQPTSTAFAVRSSATPDGQIRLGHHFSLLDANTIHKHTAVFVHHTDSGYSHAVVGWVGLIYGFSGMNSEGLTYGVTIADTLNMPMTTQFINLLFYAQLITEGIPVGIMGREILNKTSTVAEATEWLRDKKPTYGWNWLLADAEQTFTAIETHANVLDDATNMGFYTYNADTSDASNYDLHGEMLGSVGTDDLRISSHFQHYKDDIDLELFGFHIQPQRYWTSFYFRAVRAFYELGDLIDDRYGELDSRAVMDLVGHEELVDQRDSMTATVWEPEQLLLHYALGNVPATAAPWVTVDLKELFEGGGQ
jgi:Acyl-coenzyme A:6-aminopenicillanic acid acyl-transferase